jgi:hypothetical protein
MKVPAHMKIVVVGPSFPDSFARNLCVTLTAMGHDVVNLAGTRTLHFQSRLMRGCWLSTARSAFRPHRWGSCPPSICDDPGAWQCVDFTSAC